MFLPSKCLLESPFSEPLLRTVFRTLSPSKTHCNQDDGKGGLGLPFESKVLPAVLLLLRVYFPQITVTVAVLKFE